MGGEGGFCEAAKLAKRANYQKRARHKALSGGVGGERM